jgi:hypothetical protein
MIAGTASSLGITVENNLRKIWEVKTAKTQGGKRYSKKGKNYQKVLSY